MRIFLILAVGLLLAACQSVTGQTALAASCQTYANTLTNLAFQKQSLSEDHIETVDAVRAVVNPICTSIDGVEDAEDALMTLRAELRRLNAIQQEVEQ